MSGLLKLVLVSCLLLECSVAGSTSIKHMERATLSFAPALESVTDSMRHQLSELVNSTKASCSAEPRDSVVGIAVAVDPLLTLGEAERKAAARAQSVRDALLTLGVPRKIIFDWKATVNELAERQVPGSKIDLSPDVVVVEIVCTPQ